MAFRTAGDVARLTLPPGKDEMFAFDALTKGLSVRLRGTSKTYVCGYSIGGRRPKVTLGDVASMTLQEARDEAGEILRAARKGIDIGAERKAARAAAAIKAYTLGDLVRDYLTDHAEPRQRPSTLADTRRHLNVHLKALHAMPLADVTRRAVAAELLRISRSKSPIRANCVRANLSAMFAWGIRAGLCDANPVVGTIRHEQNSRDRVLSLAELRAVWAAAVKDDSPHARILRVLMLTACRRQEIAGARWDELDGDTLRLPAERCKTGKARDVAVVPEALAIIESMPRTGPYIFGANGQTPFGAWSTGRRRLDRLVQLERAWVVHDLRRSVATQLAELGIAPPHVISVVLGHEGAVQNPVTAIYNRANYLREARTALERWTALFIGDANTTNVVRLKRRGSTDS
jgi:integrase